MTDRMLCTAVFHGARDRVPVQYGTDERPQRWPDLVRQLTHHPYRPGVQKRDLPAFSPVLYRPGTTRAAANVQAVDLVVLDYDAGQTIDAERARWAAHTHLAYTSWSHTRDHHKFRVVLPLARRVLAPGWPRVFEHLVRLTDGQIDTKCSDASRIYFVPALQSPDTPHLSYVHDDVSTSWLDLDPALLPATRQEMGVRERANRRRRTRRRRAFVSEDDHRREIAKRLRSDPHLREQVARRAGGLLQDRPSGRVARGIPCPSCARPSVWFVIDPTAKRSASCEHERTCGWVGPLHDLAPQIA